FLDANTFAILALANSARYRTAIDWRRPARWIAAQGVTVAAGGRSFDGYSLIPRPVSGPPGIAWEFTGQTIAALRLAGCLYGDPQFAPQIANGIAQMGSAQVSAPFGDGLGMVASTLQDGDAIPPREQCLSTPFQCIPQRVGLAATVWALFGEAGLNPLSTTETLAICAPIP